MELYQICRWIHEAWKDIPNKLINKLLCCITNALDGKEDEQMQDDSDDDDDPLASTVDDVDIDLLYNDRFEKEQPEMYW